MPVRPKTVIIDGIHYRAVDVQEALEMRLEIYKRGKDSYKAAFIRLRDAIETHKRGLLSRGPEAGLDVASFDRELWAVLDA